MDILYNLQKAHLLKHFFSNINLQLEERSSRDILDLICKLARVPHFAQQQYLSVSWQDSNFGEFDMKAWPKQAG